VPYKPGDVMPSPAEYGAMVARVTAGWDVTLMFEPGRVIAGNAGILLTRVVRVKRGINDPFVIVDAAMNDLARPALYGSWHDFEAVRPSNKRMTANIVGPICETGDTFAMGRNIEGVEAGDLAVFRTAGAYGATMASSYNSRGFVAEVMVDGDRYAVVADRILPERSPPPSGPRLARLMKSLPLHQRRRRAGDRAGEGEAAEAKRRLVERAGGSSSRTTTATRGSPSSRSTTPSWRRRGSRRAACWSTSPTGPSCAISPCRAFSIAIPVLVAVGTGGASAGLAKQLRLRLETLLPADLGSSPTRSTPRARRCARAGPRRRRRRALDAALGQGGPLDPLAEAARAGRALAGRSRAPRRRTVP
jgi:hypothetical protein